MEKIFKIFENVLSAQLLQASQGLGSLLGMLRSDGKKKILEEKVKVPGVVVDGDIVDLRVFDETRALSSLEAFIETMDHYREEHGASSANDSCPMAQAASQPRLIGSLAG